MKSKNDTEQHFITYDNLIRLYKVNPTECTRYDEHMRYNDNMIHLYPRYNGDYELPSEEVMH
jgi:hypothetical protein